MLRLYVGGKYQGQNDLAIRENKGIIVDGEKDNIEDITKADVIVNYQYFVKKLLNENKDPLEFSKNVNINAVACDEVGCGVVPMDKEQVLYREAVGRSCCILAERAEKVIKVVCGIGVRIK